MNKIQNLIELIAAEEAQQAKLKKLIAQSESNVRVHNAALERLRFPNLRYEIKTIKSAISEAKKEEWRFVEREDVGELIKAGDTVKIAGDCANDGTYTVNGVDTGSYSLPLLVSGSGWHCEWVHLDGEAEIYLKVEK